MRAPIPSWYFAVVVVRRGDRFLLVQERKHGQRWFFPAGRVEPGETIAEAAVRETLEEAGVPVRLEGVLRFEHSPNGGDARVRVVFLASPADESPPKSVADEHSIRAGWFTAEEAARLELRGEFVRHVLQATVSGMQAVPLSYLQPEGAAW